MGKDGLAIAFDMLIEQDAGAGLGHDRGERGLADLQRIASGAVAVQLGQPESLEQYPLVSALVADQTERGNSVASPGGLAPADPPPPRPPPPPPPHNHP